jgi:hypothetical protein
MKRLTTIILVAALAVSTTGLAAAQTGPRDPARRGVRQELRIRQGVRSGQLTRGETHRLRMGQRHICRMELRARADDRLTMRERARLHRARDRQDARIWRLRHNGRGI